MSEDQTRPRIVSISLHHESYFDEIYGPLLSEIKSKAKFQRAEDAESALCFLSEQAAPTAVLVTDRALTMKSNDYIWGSVLQYVRTGGRVVMMGSFSSSVRPNDMKKFFAKAGLKWEFGSYNRTTFMLARGALMGEGNLAAKLLPAYSQEALYVKNVTPREMWYATDAESTIESAVFYPSNANVPDQTPVAYTDIGAGKLGYVGDVNGEQGSDLVVLAMCGLL